MLTQVEHGGPASGGAREAPRLALCPECGTPPGALPLHKPWWSRTRSLSTFIGLLLAALWIGHKNWHAWPAPAAPTIHPAGPGVIQFPPHPITRADLSAIAAGVSAAPLIEQFSEHLRVPQQQVTAALLPPHGHLTEFRRYGRPVPFLTRRWDGEFADVYNPAESLMPFTPREPLWSQGSHLRYRADERGRRDVRIIAVPAAATYILILAAAWFTGQLLRKAARRCVGCPRPWHPPLFARGLPIIMFTLAAAALALLATLPQDHTSIYPEPFNPETTRLGLTTCDVRQLAQRPDGDAVFARLILDALDPDTVGFLVLGLHRTAPLSNQFESHGWPTGLLAFTRSELMAPHTESRTSLRWEPFRIQLQLTRPGAGAGPEVSSTVVTGWAISSMWLAFLLLILSLAALVGRAIPASAALLARRRFRRRLMRGQCLHCAYDLSPPRDIHTA